MVPYIDPKILINSDNLKLNEKSDVYSIGVLLWEISSGKPPFNENTNKSSLIYNISQGQREEIIRDTPINYASLYTLFIKSSFNQIQIFNYQNVGMVNQTIDPTMLLRG